MLEAEQVAQLVSQYLQQIHSPGRSAAWPEFFIGGGSAIDGPAEAGGVLIDPDDVTGSEIQQVVRLIGDDEFDITH